MLSAAKKILYKVLPQILYEPLLSEWGNYKARRKLKSAYEYDFNRYIKYSGILGINSEQKLIAKIIREYHVIEKGLTMPIPRLGFGRDILIALSKDCIEYVNLYGRNNIQLEHALGVILEYDEFHKERDFQLNKDIQDSINNILKIGNDLVLTCQKDSTRDEYFKFTEASFSEFSKSRASVRNYTNSNVSIDRIEQALEIARTTPSVCNRQSWRTYVYKEVDKIRDILEVQAGNRGFGHLTNKLIVITAEIENFQGLNERNQAFVDGGMYAMNLLYALHSKDIASCILNCSNSVEKDLNMRSVCGIKESEVFIAMITCGIPPEEFKIADSKRYEIHITNTMI